jgi:hypothetical protein
MNNLTSLPKFSFYPGPIQNKFPEYNITLLDAHRAITGDYYKLKTEKLRAATNTEDYRKAKQKLDYVTFAGTFWARDKQNLNEASGYCTIDFDHIEPTHIEVIKSILINDPMLETQLLFKSPSGKGLKWIVKINLKRFPDYEINFRGIVFYLRKTYPEYFNTGDNIIDETGKDICRACFLCYDSTAYINPKYLKK